MLWRMWRKRNVHRAAARCYTPDGGEIFNRIYIVNIYNTYCAHTDTQNRNRERDRGERAIFAPNDALPAPEDARARINKLEMCACVLRGGYSVP